MSKLLKIFGNFCLIFIILICLPVAVPRALSYEEFEVISGSMEPEIPVGSICYVKATDFNNIRTGDIIAFSASASTVTHRVVEKSEADRSFITKGDANDSNDFMPVYYEDVIGVVTLHLPVLGSVAGYLNTFAGKLMAIVIILLGAVMVWLGDKFAKAPSEEVHQEVRKKKKPSVLIPILGLLIIAGALGTIYFIFNDYNSSNALYAQLEDECVDTAESVDWQYMIDVDFDELSAVNSDVIGWIYVEGTDISYPIMYSGDDEGYIHTAFDKTAAKAGSIFLEGNNSPDFSDSHSVIYGHNMRNLSMFGSLKFYKSDDTYFDQHQYFQIITKNGKSRYKIFSYFDTDPDSWVYGIPYSDCDEFSNYIDLLKKKSYRAVECNVETADSIVTLSTCSSGDRRFVVNGVLIENAAN